MVLEATEGEQRAISNILKVWEGPSIQALTRRAKVLYQLAQKQCGYGKIVELGTHHGYGAFALAYGARYFRIYTVDDYTEKQGWAGEPYGLADREIFLRNREVLDLEEYVYHIQTDAVTASEMFTRHVSLLYIDTGVKDDLPAIFDAWKGKIYKNGIIAFRDTTNRALGCDLIAADAVMSGDFRLLESPDDYFILLGRKD